MKNIIYNSQYQNLHMDRAKKNSMFTVNIKVNSNLSNSTTPRLLFSYPHGYNYVPQFWGLWDVKYAQGGLGGGYRRGYGRIVNNTGFGLLADFFYVVDSSSVKLYFLFNSIVSGTNTAGTTATFTGYLFANDSTVDQDYTAKS